MSIALPDSVTAAEGEGGLPVLRVATALVTGEVYLHGAHVTAWTPAGADPVLWVSNSSRFAAGEPIRGGVPICFPWFGAGREPGLAPPPHGFARLAPWRLVSAEEHDGGAVTLALTVENTGDGEISFEEALHTYLAVADVRTTTVEGLDGATYLDKAPGGGPERVTQHGDVTFTAETDRVYDSEGTAVVVDESAGRRIGITKEGSAHTVVWNPWVDKAAAMPDYGDDEWPQMVCVETANALDAAITLAPGERHTMTASHAVAR